MALTVTLALELAALGLRCGVRFLPGRAADLRGRGGLRDGRAAVLLPLSIDRAVHVPGVGNGVALPHARLDGLEHVVGALVLLEKPVDFSAVDRQPVDLVFALFAPRDAGVEHLKALALVSRTLRDPSVCAKLRANTDPMTLYTIVTEAQAAQAA